VDGASAATTAAAKGTARRDDTATATAVVLADAATAHVCNPGLQAAATAPDPASPPTNVAIPTATATTDTATRRVGEGLHCSAQLSYQ
jgi:hypothetical protein